MDNSHNSYSYTDAFTTDQYLHGSRKWKEGRQAIDTYIVAMTIAHFGPQFWTVKIWTFVVELYMLGWRYQLVGLSVHQSVSINSVKINYYGQKHKIMVGHWSLIVSM